MSDLHSIFRKIKADTKPESNGQDATQLALWDTEAIENGYKLMHELDLTTAVKKFSEAINLGIGDRDELENALACCRFWKEKLDGLNGSEEVTSRLVADFLKSYREYPFISMHQRFKKKLLEFFVAQNQAILARDSVLARNAAGLLFLIDNYNASVGILEAGLTHFPDDADIQYALARAYWFRGDFDKANEIYFGMLFHHPDRVDASRIENHKLQRLISEHGVNLALAYGTIYEVITLKTIPEKIDFVDDDHRVGVKCLIHIRESRNARRTRDQKADMQHRKKLHSLSPEVCQAYIKSLPGR